jgi:uncharacterized protein
LPGVVSNASPLIAFEAIGQLDLFPGLFQSILIPPAVAFEITPSIPVHPSWLHIQDLRQPIPEAALNPSLGDGEREALALAVEIRADRVILDDLPARRVALLEHSFFMSRQLYEELLRLAGEQEG